MNRNTIIGLILIFAIFIGWSYWMQPSEEELEQQRQEQLARSKQERVSDSLQELARLAQETRIAEQKQEKELMPVTADSSASFQLQKQDFGAFVNAGTGDEEFITVENDVMKLVFSTKGGRVYSVELKNYKVYDSSRQVILFESDTNRFGYKFVSKIPVLYDSIWTSKSVHLSTNDLYFEAVLPDKYSGGNEIKVENGESVEILFRLYPDVSDGKISTGRYLEMTYTIHPKQYMIGHEIRLKDMENIIYPLDDNSLRMEWHTQMLRHEKTQDRLNGTTIYYREQHTNESDFSNLSENSNDEENFDLGKFTWVSLKQRFFTSTLISDNHEIEKLSMKQFAPDDEANSDYYSPMMNVELSVPVQNPNDHSSQFRFYFGPLKYSILRKYDLGLERQIPLGWSFPYILSWINRFAVIPVFDWLGHYGMNYGIVILILTILLKIVLFPIAYRTYRSTAKMRVLKPEVDEIAKKFPKKEDSMKKQQATMALYKKAGVNPMAGCVPMLLQFPILIALFRFFPSSIELRQQSFLWAEDLSSYDSIASLPFEIPFYGDHVSLFTLLMTVSTIIYTWMNNQMMSSSQQMPGMKTMMYLMPVMFLGIFNNYASGLSYYYFLANIITFGQMFVIRRTINEDKIYKKLQENKKKPKKQSGFSKRLEAAAKKYNNPPKKR